MSLINTQVQPFKAQAFHNGKFIEVTDESLKGKWSVLIFMPAAFTFNCPTEVEDAADNYAEFQKAGAEVYIVTTDTHFSHKVWHETSPAVGKAQFPLVGDPTHALTNAFGVHIPEEGLALRGTFVIDPQGVIKTMEVHDNAIARDVKETLRKLKAAQFVANNPGNVCPAKWNEGAKTIKPSLDLVGKIAILLTVLLRGLILALRCSPYPCTAALLAPTSGRSLRTVNRFQAALPLDRNGRHCRPFA